MNPFECIVVSRLSEMNATSSKLSACVTPCCFLLERNVSHTHKATMRELGVANSALYVQHRRCNPRPTRRGRVNHQHFHQIFRIAPNKTLGQSI